MIKGVFLFTVAAQALMTPAAAETRPAAPAADASPQSGGGEGGNKEVEKEVFSTGVAKGRDRLDSATSTSSIRASEVEKMGARSLPEVLRSIPGLRVEANGTEGNVNYTIRGLPLAASGSKFLQLQEDGLPIIEFGDLYQLSPDLYLRGDFNLAQIEAIRGGSASTFASNSPGGVINLISKTGDVEGGAVQTTIGLDYDERRVDADYGAKLSDTLRFHIGGFYRKGEGPRALGYDAFRGGQLKLNVTKQFAEGYVRLYAKLLDDRTPAYTSVPMLVGGTDADPSYSNVGGFDARRDTLLSPSFTSIPSLDSDNRLTRYDVRDGRRSLMKSIGFETQFDLGEWTITNRFRFSDISGQSLENLPTVVGPAQAIATQFGGPGARLSYATGPLAGQPITSPSTLNGNGLLLNSLFSNLQVDSLDNLTNDVRVSRGWDLSGGKLTTTAGLYKAVQSIATDWLFGSIISDVRGDGQTSLVNITTATGVPQTQNGYFAFSALPVATAYRRTFDVDYAITAPYASVNYHLGQVAVGASVRYEMGKARGRLFGGELGGGRASVRPFDINGNGAISQAETRTGFIPLTQPAPVDYNYGYLSYSAGVNWRISEPLAVFGRYSRGGRASADRILFVGLLDANGHIIDPADAYDPVRQTEIGLKLRQANATLNVTGFLADTSERNQQINSGANGAVRIERIIRDYRAYGVEVEGAIRSGPFSLSAGATYAKAEITKDQFRPELVGRTPRRQPKLVFQMTPQVTTDVFSIGGSVYGVTSSYAQDTNQLKLPAYTVVNAFVQVRPIDRVQLMLTANNLFDTIGLTSVTQATIPTSGVITARTIAGRTVAASVRVDF